MELNTSIPPEIDETKTDFSQIVKPTNNFLEKIPWLVATFLSIAVIALSWQNVTSNEVFYKIFLPIILIYAAAAAWKGSLHEYTNQQPTKIWYKTSFGYRGKKRVACTWQGWLIDVGTLLLMFINIVIAAIPFSATIDYSSTANPSPQSVSLFFISLTPLLLIVGVNFWIRNKYSNKI